MFLYSGNLLSSLFTHQWHLNRPQALKRCVSRIWALVRSVSTPTIPQTSKSRPKHKSHTYPFECKVLLAAVSDCGCSTIVRVQLPEHPQEFANFAKRSSKSTSVLLNETDHFTKHLSKQKLFSSDAVQDNFANPVSIALDAGLAVVRPPPYPPWQGVGNA